jgi:hypothetical protein
MASTYLRATRGDGSSEILSQTLNRGPKASTILTTSARMHLKVGEEQGVFRIAERYLKGRVTLHLHLRVRPGRPDADTCELCAVVVSDRGDIVHVDDLCYVPDQSGIPRELARVLAFGAVAHADRHAPRDDTADVWKPVL